MPSPTSSQQRIRVVLADDHEIVRVGVRRLLLSDETFDVVAEASTGEEAVYLVERERPNVILMDVMMPHMDGIEAARRIKQFPFLSKVVMLTTFEDQQSLERALQSGADGYLAKSVSRHELHDALRNVVQGKRVFSKNLMSLMQGMTVHAQIGAPRNVSITKREEEILHLVAEGLTSNEIGSRLFISPRTVETHRANLMDKIGVSNMAGLVRYAVLHTTYFPESEPAPGS